MLALDEVELECFVKKEDAQLPPALRFPTGDHSVTFPADFVGEIFETQSFDHRRLSSERLRRNARLWFGK